MWHTLIHNYSSYLLGIPQCGHCQLCISSFNTGTDLSLLSYYWTWRYMHSESFTPELSNDLLDKDSLSKNNCLCSYVD